MAKRTGIRWMTLALASAMLVWVAAPAVWQNTQSAFAQEDAAAPADAAPAPADAAPADAAPAAGGQKIPDNALQLIINSGVFGWTLVFLSIALLALSIQTFIEYKPEKLIPEDILDEIIQSLDNGEYDQALEICGAEDSFMTRILGAGLGKMANGFGRMEEAIGEEAETQATLLHQRLGYINLIATLAPMLGLLGTVSGMVGAFKEIALNPTANASDLAGGIYEALTTTLMGLVVAIPGTVIFTVLRNRTVKTVMDMGVICGEILDRFRVEEG